MNLVARSIYEAIRHVAPREVPAWHRLTPAEQDAFTASAQALIASLAVTLGHRDAAPAPTGGTVDDQ